MKPRMKSPMTQRSYLALSVQIPGVFALFLCGALLAFNAGQPVIMVWLLAAAAWCARLSTELVPHARRVGMVAGIPASLARRFS